MFVLIVRLLCHLNITQNHWVHLPYIVPFKLREGRSLAQLNIRRRVQNQRRDFSFLVDPDVAL